MNKSHAIWYALTVPLAWGVSYPFMKVALATVPPLTIVALRCGIAFLATALILRPQAMAVNRRALGFSAVLGALLAGVFLGLLYGVAGTSASVAGFLTSTTVLIVPLLHSLWTRVLPGRQVMAGLVPVTLGLYFISGADLSGISYGAWGCFAASFLYSLHVLFSNFAVQRISPLCLGVWQLGFAALFSGVAAFLLETPVLPYTPSAWLGVLGLALICSAYGFVMQAVVQKYLSPETTAFLFSLEPIFSAVVASVFLAEVLGPYGYLGTALIFTGVLIATFRWTTNKDKAASKVAA